MAERGGFKQRVRGALGTAATKVAKLPPVKRAMAKHVAEAEKVRAHNERVAEKVSWFLRTPRWYQDALRPNFRGKARKYGRRPVSAEGQAARQFAAEVKRAQRGAKRRADAASIPGVLGSGYHYVAPERAA